LLPIDFRYAPFATEVSRDTAGQTLWVLALIRGRLTIVQLQFSTAETAHIRVKQVKTFGGILDENRGIGPGFDLVRIGLAILILIAHTGWITAGVPLPSSEPSAGTASLNLSLLKRPFSECLVPMFFALSGFLVTGSALRLRTVGKFMSARLFRLVPALCVEVTLSALVLGPIYTGYPLTAYFTDPVFYRYFLNMFGFITFELPGVFVDNPWPRIVNINLWTLPSEFYCYLFMCAALVSKLVMHRAWYSWAFAACFVVLVLLNAFDMIVSGFVGVAVEVLIYSFFVGVLFFMWRERIVYSWPLFLLCSLLTYAAIYPVVYPNDLRQRLCRAHQAPADPASDLGRLLVWPVPLRLSDLAGADGLVARISRASVPVRCPHAAAGDRVRRVLLACD
jgi:hypothetical protein